MKPFRCLPLLLLALLAWTGGALRAAETPAAERVFTVTGTVQSLPGEPGIVRIAHDEIPGFMRAMTMNFRARNAAEVSGLATGDRVRFQLHVTDSASWITDVQKAIPASADAGRSPAPAVPPPLPPPSPGVPAVPAPPPAPRLGNFIADIVFTNQLGREVRWSEFDGKAVGFTFFFTRCPLPEYCPRLAKNLAGAQQKLSTEANAPTNWHLVSITIDPTFDTPNVLKAYAQAYGADPARWSFLTAAPTNIARLAQMFGLSYSATNNTIDHDFRTVVLDAAGRVQAVWPIGGDTTDTLVGELRKGMQAPTGK